MIAIIADDFTGAAELAGISLRYGLKVELCIGEVLPTDADVLIVSTDSRSLKKAEALAITEYVLEQVLKLKPEWVFKKIDSVLRGYVLDELRLQMRQMHISKAFILAANPSLGRTINNGVYFVQGKPICETSFASDPEFPIRQSSVQAILQDDTVLVLKHTDELPATGIVVGEAENDADIEAWSAKMDGSFLLAGAGDFFTVLLNIKFQSQPQKDWKVELPLLYMCGTAYDQALGFVKQVENENDVVLFISRQIIEQRKVNDEWLLACNRILQQKRKAIIAFKSEWIPAEASAVDLRSIMAKAVKSVMEQNEISELFIEGGSTAAAVLHQLSINHLSPVHEWQRGVVRMKSGDLYITVKPGSYALPKEIKEQFGN